MMNLDENFWSSRYREGSTGWDLNSVSPPLYQYLCQIKSKEYSVLVPGAGNAYEIEAAWSMGFKNVHLLDISAEPINNFLKNNPEFPEEQTHHQDFFQHLGQYDLIIEQTFFCALDPSLRPDYAKKMHDLLNPGGKLVGVLFNRIFPSMGPPFGGSAEEYRGYFEPYFDFEVFEPCYNSHPARMGSELFVVLKKLDS